MRLIPWTREDDTVGTLQRQMNRLFDEIWPGVPAARAWAPALDVSETENEVIVRTEIPGIDPKEVEVTVLGDTLQLRGEKSEQKEEKQENWHRVERRYGSFARSVRLPCFVDSQKASAEADNGVLTITFAKREEDRTRKIDIRVK